MKNLDILFTDNHLLAINKPSGMLVQGDRTGDESLLALAKDYLKERFGKPGNVYLGLVHRLDRPVSGVVLFARTSKAAARLSEQFRERKAKKTYLAIVEGETPLKGKWTDPVAREGATSRIAEEGEGQNAELSFRRLKCNNKFSLVEIDLGTGRHHQIRVQFADRGHPIAGDFRYGSKIKFPGRAIALHSLSLTVAHPTKKEEITFRAEPPESWKEFIDL